MTVGIGPIKPLIGGIVHVDTAHPTDPEVVEDRGVLLFPQIHATDDEQLALTDALGNRVNFTHSVPGLDATHQDVYKITLNKSVNSEPDYVLGTFLWHIDGIAIDQPLLKATLVSARTLSSEGGSTEFANLYAAHDRLSDRETPSRHARDPHHRGGGAPRVRHPAAGPAGALARMAEPMEQPLVWTHDDGRKSLLLGNHTDGIVGWRGPNGRSLLWRLMQWAAQPNFVYTHEWQVGDLVLWNNKRPMRRVVPYTDPDRVMHRTTIAGGEKPEHATSAEAMAKMLETVY
ncbi:TauD/TfdA family dioxygenase [Sphingobium sufflavum]|uniref:TauD/TfdA dioxygenase family protein n=1 Tax=Sphingobium sufflavum TaxID=1129547 RepID=UPI001F42E78F|nr:TauD/TfdA family dioxygenase [Sphingobium sufflavum]MCE7795560.1 TauD/TfdA family dioxygenase [Sphingobium sufflavum]